MEMLLEGKTAVVYGAGGAIGGAVARTFACEGARVFLAGRTLAKVEAVAGEISAAGGAAEAARVDALDELAVEKHFDDVGESAGGVDVLFNAIGMEDIQGTPLLDMPLEDLEHPVVTALRTQFLTARAAGRRMIRQGSGAILTVTAEPTPSAKVGGFGAACAAIEGLWRSFAVELGPHGVRLVVIRSAGSPDSPDVQEIWRVHAEAAGRPLEEYTADSGSGALLKRLPLLAEVAGAATIMASDRASAMTGAIANVTCGAFVDL